MRVAVFNDTRAGGHYGCDLVMLELDARLRAGGLEPVWWSGVGEDWRQRADIPRRPDIDAVVVNGEGSIHHSATNPRAVQLAGIANFAHRELSVPAFLINATITDIDPTVAADLRAFDFVSVRERETQRTLAQLGIESMVAPDLTVMARLPSPATRAGVCGTDSVVPEASAAIAERCAREGWPVYPIKWSHDAAAAHALGDPERLAGVEAYAAKLASAELVVTGRFHAVTMCVATRTPFVALESNTTKISAYLTDLFGGTDRVITPDRVRGDDLARFARWHPVEDVALADRVALGEERMNALFLRLAVETRR